jgi:hypothetical protein
LSISVFPTVTGRLHPGAQNLVEYTGRSSVGQRA